MKLILLLSVFSATIFGFFVKNDQKSGQKLVDYVNSVQNLFVAQNNQKLEEKIKSIVMDFSYASINTSEYTTTGVQSTINSYIPDNFDSRTHWPSCRTIKIIRNQWSCGCCWAMSAAEIISDRICIKTNGRSQPEISVDELISCAAGDGCTGGLPIRALYYWTTSGIVTGGDYGEGGCKPYSQGPCGFDSGPCNPPKAPACTQTCKAGYPVSFANDKHYGLSSYAVDRSVAAIQTEIMTNGPVVTLFTVYADLVHYKTGVYKHTNVAKWGLHAVKIIGWGTENGTPYWLVSNSWGTTWGEAGFFKILRGSDECGIEEFISAGISREV